MNWRTLSVICLQAACLGAQPPTPATVEEAGLRQLQTIRRIYVDHLTGGEPAAQMREILISSMDGTKLFIVTENQERADAILRGGAEDLVFTEVHNSSDSINARANVGIGKSTNSSRGQNAGFGIGESDSEHSAERRHEAIASVRLVNKEGDVIWSTVQESLGAKFHGASADVAGKIAAKLKEDIETARKLR